MTKKDFIALDDHIERENHMAVGYVRILAKGYKCTMHITCARNIPRSNVIRWLDYVAGKCGARWWQTMSPMSREFAILTMYLSATEEQRLAGEAWYETARNEAKRLAKQYSVSYRWLQE